MRPRRRSDEAATQAAEFGKFLTLAGSRNPLRLGDGRFHLGSQLREGMLILHSHFRQHLAIDRDRECVESVNKLAVGDAIGAGGGADAKDPEPAEIALLAAPVAKSVTARFIRRFLHGAVEFAFCEEKTFGDLGKLFAVGAAHSSALDSRHGFLLFK